MMAHTRGPLKGQGTCIDPFEEEGPSIRHMRLPVPTIIHGMVPRGSRYPITKDLGLKDQVWGLNPEL